ncbi:MAG TPA: hypothetical protein VF526_18090 [Solirubrobacteraceae bacterium]
MTINAFAFAWVADAGAMEDAPQRAVTHIASTATTRLARTRSLAYIRVIAPC